MTEASQFGIPSLKPRATPSLRGQPRLAPTIRSQAAYFAAPHERLALRYRDAVLAVGKRDRDLVSVPRA